MDAPGPHPASEPAARRSPVRAGPHGFLEVLWAFGRLGLTSFGGPAAHLGYFREEFVVRRRWLADADFTDLVALCQFLPGPASSQVGFSIGLRRAGVWGALAAWAGFTLPSALFMVSIALGATTARGPAAGALHGLRLVAVAVVAQALWGMARTLCADRQTASIGALAAAACLWVASSGVQWAAILGGALTGWAWCRDSAATAGVGGRTAPPIVTRGTSLAALAIFALLLALTPLVARWPMGRLFEAFFEAGASVFGGGHVVLPLLRSAFVGPGWVSDDAFLAGYGAAQAMPGPLFTFAAYLGAIAAPAAGPLAGAACGIAGIFLPGLLLVTGVLPYWDRLRTRMDARAVMRGVNASVVGILGAAFYEPIWTSTVLNHTDVTIALVGFVLLTAWNSRPWLIVMLGAAAGVAQHALP